MRLFFLWVLASTSFYSVGFASGFDLESCSAPLEVTSPNIVSGFEITGSALFLQPSAGNLGWGIVTDFLPFISPQWHVQALEPDYQAGCNVRGRYIFSCSGMDSQLNWNHLHTYDVDSVTVTPVLQWVSPFSQTGPGTADTAYDPTGVGELTTSKATVNFHYDAVNLDVGTFVTIGCNTQVRLFTGLSGVRIKEKLISIFQSVEDPLPIISIDNTSSYWGVGPRLGLDTFYKIFCNLSFTGQLGAALLFGTMQPAEYLFSGSSVDLQAVGISVNHEEVSSSRVSQAVPAFDAKLGLKYAYLFSKRRLLNLEVGYMGALYINPLSGYEPNTNILSLELGSLSAGTMRHVQSDFSVNGPYIAISLKY